MKKKNILIAASVIAGIALLSYYLPSTGFKPLTTSASPNSLEKQTEAIATAEPVIQISASDLLKQYDDNEIKADELYDGRKIEVTGKIDSISKDITGDPYITLSGGSEFSWTSITCYLNRYDTPTAEKIMELSEDSTATLIGRCSGKSWNILVYDCKMK